MKRTLIIAEAGVNHGGNIHLAKKLIDVAKDCAVDIIKFQTAIPESLVSKTAKKAQYQEKNTGSDELQLEMIKKLVLTFEEFEELYAYCRQKKILFLSTPFDLESIEFLNQFDMPFWKIPSGEITNFPYLVKIANTHKPIVMSTGMCNMEEIAMALEVLKKNGASDIKLLHCNTEYPTPYQDVNLRAMKTLRDKFFLEVGYSDHTKGIEVPIAAVAMGATIIEKHFTLNKNMEGPDHKASIEPNELEQMVKSIRNIEEAMGDFKKQPTESEYKNIVIARKSIVARRFIKKGEKYTEENITTKRPGDGISPMFWQEVLGTLANQDYEEDEQIKFI